MIDYALLRCALQENQFVRIAAGVVADAIKKGKRAAKKHHPEESPRRNTPDEVPLQQQGPTSEVSYTDSRCGRILIS